MGRLIEIFGKAGSGKTLAIINIIKEAIKQDLQCLIITDEAYPYIKELANNNTLPNNCQVIEDYNRIVIPNIEQFLRNYVKVLNTSIEGTYRLIVIDCDKFRENVGNNFINRIMMLAKSSDNVRIVLSRQYNMDGVITENYHDIIYSVNKKGDDTIEITNVAPWDFTTNDTIFNFKYKTFNIN